MNTKYIKKVAISEALGELLAGTCKYSPEDLAAHNGIMEPDVPGLMQFVEVIGVMAKRHFYNKLEKWDVENAIEYCEDIARPIGHLLSNGWNTGTWGCRLSDLDNILKILELEDFELLKIGSKITNYELELTISNYRISADWLVVTYKYENGEYGIQEWEDVIYWKDLEKFKENK